MNNNVLMRQVAPYPQALADLVERLRYRRDRGWEVKLEDDLQRDKPGRHIGESRGMTLVVTRCGPDSYDPDQIIAVNHYFAVPAATYNEESWRRWLFDRLGDVDTHERMEDFKLCDTSPEPDDECVCGCAARLHDGRDSSCAGCDAAGHRFEQKTDRCSRPYAPCHGPGWDPYLITVERTAVDRRTSFRGEVDS